MVCLKQIFLHKLTKQVWPHCFNNEVRRPTVKDTNYLLLQTEVSSRGSQF